MKHHPIMRWIYMLSWLISSLAAINMGLYPFGYDFFRTEFVLMNLYRFVPAMHYIILISGLISLGLFVMSASGNCGCGSKSCK